MSASSTVPDDICAIPDALTLGLAFLL